MRTIRDLIPKATDRGVQRTLAPEPPPSPAPPPVEPFWLDPKPDFQTDPDALPDYLHDDE